MCVRSGIYKYSPLPFSPAPCLPTFFRFSARRHYIVHTRYLPTSRLGRRVRMHHLLHHTRSEAHWLAFTVPEVDKLFGTLPPDPAAIRMSDMARASLKAGRLGGL
jgi:hypothetical protein